MKECATRQVLKDYRILSERPLIDQNGRVYVMISHSELDNLIGSLMHLMDLNSDVQFREAMKSEIKMRTRQWLNDEYCNSGYEYNAYISGAKVIGIGDDYELVIDTAK
jgi:hypothetical protein